jgi:hypothetical protein
MKRKDIIRIVLISLGLLIIPLIGQLTVDGWSWGWNDFLFAWVFFTIVGITYKFFTRNTTTRNHKLAVGAGVAIFFGFIWGMLATG